jgi:hypothetical protein
VDYTVSKVKYLGNKSYEVFTDKGEFIVIADYSDNDLWKYKIFKYDDEYEYLSRNYPIVGNLNSSQHKEEATFHRGNMNVASLYL